MGTLRENNLREKNRTLQENKRIIRIEYLGRSRHERLFFLLRRDEGNLTYRHVLLLVFQLAVDDAGQLLYQIILDLFL